MNVRICDGPNCDQHIVFVKLKSTGRHHPMNHPPVRRFVQDERGEFHKVDTYESHYATCPDAERFRNAKR